MKGSEIWALSIFLAQLVILMPMVSALNITSVSLNLGVNKTTVQWTTNDFANGSVEYGTNGTMSQEASSSLLVTAHAFDMNTTDRDVYKYRIRSCAGNCTEYDSKFVAGPDVTPPQMDFIVPEFLNKGRVNIEGTVEAFSRVYLYVNERLERILQPDSTEDGTAKFSGVLIDEGQNEIKIDAEDSANNRNSQTFSLTVDVVPPEVEIVDFPETLTSPQLMLNGRVNEPAHVEIYVGLEKDEVPPSKVEAVTVTEIESNKVILDWEASTSTDLLEYGIFRDNKLIALTKESTFQDLQVEASREYTYRITAIDTSCNFGSASDSRSVMVPSGETLNVTEYEEKVYSCESPYAVVDTDGDFAVPIQMENEGPLKIIIVVTDLSGNTVEIQKETYLDTRPPEFLSTNLHSLSPSYERKVKVRGQLTEKATVFVYVNDMETHQAFAVSDESGNFEIPITLSRKLQTEDYRVEYPTKFSNKVKLVAVDAGGHRVETPVADVVYALCDTNSYFSVEISDPMPVSLIPRLMLEGEAMIAFNLKLDYLDIGEAQFRSPPVIRFRDINEEEVDEWDEEWGQPLPLQCNSDYTVCAFQFQINSLDGFFDKEMTRLEKEKNLSNHRKGECFPGFGCMRVPLQMEINFNRKTPKVKESGVYDDEYLGSYDIEPLSQKQCIPVSISIDKPIDPGFLPDGLLSTTVTLFNAVIDGIDAVLEPLKQIYSVAIYSCLFGTMIMYFFAFQEEQSCAMGQLLGVAEGEGFSKDVARVGLCEQVYQGDDEVVAMENCLSCQESIDKNNKMIRNLQWFCDRVYCPAAPSFQKYISDMQEQPVKKLMLQEKELQDLRAELDLREAEIFSGSDCASPIVKQKTTDQGKKNKRGLKTDFGTIAALYKDWKDHKNDVITETDEINCAGPHPLTEECCGYEYMQVWGSACGVGQPESVFDEIKESYCLGAQESGTLLRGGGELQDEAMQECAGFRTIYNSVAGFCDAQSQPQGKLISIDPYHLRKTNDSAYVLPRSTVGLTQDEARVVLTPIRRHQAITQTEDILKARQKAKQSFIKDKDKAGIPWDVTSNKLFVKIIPPQNIIGPSGEELGSEEWKILRGYVDTKYEEEQSTAENYVNARLGFNDVYPDLTQYFIRPEATGKALTEAPPGFATDLCLGVESGHSNCMQDASKWYQTILEELGLEGKDYIVDPASSFLRSAQCLCIPGVNEYLKKWRNILAAVRNCFEKILITGDGDAGVCQAALSTYICESIYDLIRCFADRYDTDFGSNARTSEGGLAGIGNTLGALTKAGSRVQQRIAGRYGKTALYKSMFVEKRVVNAVCLFAFTGTWDLDVTALLEEGVGAPPIASTGLVFPARRRFVAYDLSTTPPGRAKWNYHIGVMLAAGAALQYNLKIQCSADYSCSEAEGFKDGACDCVRTGEKSMSVPVGNNRLKKNDVLNEEVLRTIASDIRYDKACLEWSYRDNQNKMIKDEVCRELSQTGGDAPAECAFDILTNMYRCSFDIGLGESIAFSRTPFPNYQFSESEMFILPGTETTEGLSFTVPIVQKVPDGVPCPAGLCSYTKFLTYEIRNSDGAIVAHNNPFKLYGSDTNQEQIYSRGMTQEFILNTNGEKDVIISPPELADVQGIKNAFAKAAIQKGSCSYLPSQSGISSCVDNDATRDKPMVVEITNDDKYMVYVVDKMKTNAAGTEFTHGNAGYVEWEEIGDDRLINTRGVTIKVSSAEKIKEAIRVNAESKKTDKITIYVPSTKEAAATKSSKEKCSEHTQVPDTWTILLKVHTSKPVRSTYDISEKVAYDPRGMEVMKEIPFKVLCNDHVVERRDDGRSCNELLPASYCSCSQESYDTRKPDCGFEDKGDVCLDGVCFDRDQRGLTLCEPNGITPDYLGFCVCGVKDKELMNENKLVVCQTDERCVIKEGEVTNECVPRSAGTTTRGTTEPGVQITEPPGTEGWEHFKDPKPNREPTFKDVEVTFYYHPYEADFPVWSSGGVEIDGDTACKIPERKRGFYEAVECEGWGKGKDAKFYSFNTIKPTKEDSKPAEKLDRAYIVKRTLAAGCGYADSKDNAYLEIPDVNNPGKINGLWSGWYKIEDTGQTLKEAWPGKCKVDLFMGWGKTLAWDRATKEGVSKVTGAKMWIDEKGDFK